MTVSQDDLIDTLFTAILLLDPQGQICYANAASEQLFGTSTKNLCRQRIAQIFQHTAIDIDTMRAGLTPPQSLRVTDIELILQGQSRWIDLHLSAFWRNETIHTVLECQPVHQQRQISEQAQQQAQLQAAKELIRGLAHEIKNPLGGIRGAAQLLEKMRADDELKDYTQLIISQADRLKDLVDRLLGPQKLSQKQQQNIHSVLENVRRLIELEAPHIQIVRDYDPSLPELWMDSAQMEQAILNIAQNAMFAMKDTENPKLQLKTRSLMQVMIGEKKHRLALQIDIIDNGCGIDPSIQNTLFYPMVSGRAEGTGLGLAITRDLIAQHQGQIRAFSDNINTILTILLPIIDEEHR